MTGFTSAGTAITLFPYANLNTNVNSLGGNHAFLEYATNDGNTNYEWTGRLASQTVLERLCLRTEVHVES